MKKKLLIILAFCLCLAACKSREDPISGSQPQSEEAAQNQRAQAAYEEGRIEDSIKQYAEIMKQNPLDMEARLGTAKCQIALGNYDMAAMNLSSATRVNPREGQIYDLYIQLSEESNNISYANIAVNLAKTHKIQSFLDKVPEAPTINLPEGRYDSRMEVSITAEEGTDIYFLERKDNSSKREGCYVFPLSITNGKTELEVYCVKDGIPSEPVTAQYICQYGPTEITFEDPVFEKMVRASIDNFNEPITDVECEQLTRLDQDSMYSGMDYQEYEGLQIHTLNDLKWFPNLEQLNLRNQDQIVDFSPIAYCRRLVNLNLRYCNLTDISFVAGLSDLDILGISENQVSDLSPLSSLTDIDSLDICSNPVTDLEVIRGKEITYFSVDANQISDPTILGSLKNLKILDVYESGRFDFSCLTDIPTLTHLYLHAHDSVGNRDEIPPIKDISFLQNFLQLESLSIDGLADFSQIEVVKKLMNLTYAYFRTLDYKSPPEELIQDLRASLPGCLID